MNKLIRTLSVAVLVVIPSALASPAWAETPVVADAPPIVYLTFQHEQSGKCLDGSVGQGVRLNNCNGGRYQQWRVDTKDGTTRLRNRIGGECLDGSVGQGVRLNTCNGSSYQKWVINSDSKAIPHVQSQLCLDGSVGQGVRLNTCNGSSYQKWSH